MGIYHLDNYFTRSSLPIKLVTSNNLYRKIDYPRLRNCNYVRTLKIVSINRWKKIARRAINKATKLMMRYLQVLIFLSARPEVG